MKKFYIKSLGCKQNQLEGQIIKDKLLSSGFKSAKNIKDADIYILNSCTVTSHADSQTNYLLNHAKKENPNLKAILTGCVAQTIKEHKNFNYSIADLILGNSEKMNIVKRLMEMNMKIEDISKITDLSVKEIKELQ